MQKEKRLNRLRKSKRGYTLMELLVVLIILGGILAIATPQLFKYLDGAKVDTAEIQIERLSGILDLYRLDTGSYPSTSSGLGALTTKPSGAKKWNGPYLKKDDSLVDPWGNPYQYRYPGEQAEFDLFSYGADGQEGGDDNNADVTNW